MAVKPIQPTVISESSIIKQINEQVRKKPTPESIQYNQRALDLLNRLKG